jgi:hypothetical protein
MAARIERSDATRLKDPGMVTAITAIILAVTVAVIVYMITLARMI